MDFDKKKLIAMVEKKLQDLVDSEDLVDTESMAVVKGKPMEKESQGLMELLKMMGGGKAKVDIESEDEGPLEISESMCPMCEGEGCEACEGEDDGLGVSAKNKKMIMMALSKK